MLSLLRTRTLCAGVSAQTAPLRTIVHGSALSATASSASVAAVGCASFHTQATHQRSSLKPSRCMLAPPLLSSYSTRLSSPLPSFFASARRLFAAPAKEMLSNTPLPLLRNIAIIAHVDHGVSEEREVSAMGVQLCAHWCDEELCLFAHRHFSVTAACTFCYDNRKRHSSTVCFALLLPVAWKRLLSV